MNILAIKYLIVDSSSTNKREIDKVFRFRGEYGRKAET